MTNDRTVCRACAAEVFEYRDLYKEGFILGEVTTLATLLSFCTDIEFPPEESDLPSVICDKCVQQLAKAYKFKQQVLQANEQIRGAMVNANKSEYGNCDNTKFVMVNVLTTSESGDEFIISEHLEEDELIVSLPAEDELILEEDSQDMEFIVDTKNELQDSTVEVDGTEEHISLETEEMNDYLVDMEVDDCKTVNEDSIFELKVVKSRSSSCSRSVSESQSPLHSRSQSQESEQPSDSTTEDKLLKIMSQTQPVRKRNVKPRTESSNPVYQCKVCGKQLSNSNSFKYHMQLHSDNTPYLCSLCGEKFKTRNAYDGHIIQHDPNNPNTCKLCGKSYRQPSSLRSHMLTHTGERPFVCDICGKGMTQKSGYKKHMLTHTGEKPHVCDYCGREFRYSSNLIAHRRSHTGEKPYECSVCSKCFVSSEQLKRHMFVHTGDRPYKCDLCDKRFKRRTSLNSHQQTHHSPTTEATCVPVHNGGKTVKSNLVEIY